jgi:3-oxoadipate enol-lactonase
MAPVPVRRELTRLGRAVSYLEAGAPSPSGGTLLLLHAFPLAADMWRPQLEAVPDGWRFVAPDLRGFGASALEDAPAGGAPPVSIDDYAADAVALLDHLDVGRAVVAGLSMGGYAAFAIVRAAPGRLRGLVLADTRAEADGETARAARDAMLERLAEGGPAAVAERMLPGLLGATTRASRPGTVDLVRALAVAQPGDAIARAILRLKSRPDSTPLLSAIDVPTLVLVGAEDEITGPDDARRMHEGIAGSRLERIDGAGHLSNLEAPAAFNAALLRFLAGSFARDRP